MGLINRNEADDFRSPYIENYEQHIDNTTVVSTDEEDSDSQHGRQQSIHVRRSHRARHTFSVSQENLTNYGRRKGGVRRTRRVDNLRYLMNLEEKDEDAVMNDPSSTFEPSSSLFEELLDNPDKMEMWNSFVESSEEEQMRILNYRGLHDIKEDDEMDDESDTEGKEKSSEEEWTLILDKRSDHPAYSPKECYSRVDKRLRTLLKRRQLPMGMLANLEREIITYFHDCPDSVFISDISSSYERMLLHALCQYLNLSSQSYDDNGGRRTQVENQSEIFHPPSLLLSEYLQLNQHCL